MIYRQGSIGPEVSALNARLKELGYYEDELTDKYTEETERAVWNFQVDHFAEDKDIDGIVGPRTWVALFPAQVKPTLTKLTEPIMQSQMTSRFGNPNSASAKSNIILLNFAGIVPDEFMLSMKGISTKGGARGFYGHKDLLNPLIQAFNKMHGMGLKFRTWDGCHNIRQMTGGGGYSTHSWGYAVDFDAAQNAYGATPKMDKRIVNAFALAGFEWGGLWRTPDGMHFQLCWTRDWRTVRPHTNLMPG